MKKDQHDKQKTACVLIVDDSRTSRLLIHCLIEELRPHIEVIEAANVSDALLCTEQKIVHAAVIDFHLPDGNGLDLALLLQQRYPQIKLAIISGDSHIPIQTQHENLHFTQLGKPIKPLGFLKFLQKKLGVIA